MLNLSGMLSFVAVVAPPQTCQPLIVESAKSNWETWISVGVGFLQFSGLAWLTWYIFVAGSRQKVAERQASWYHKIVVDHSIGILADFFKKASAMLCQCTEDLSGLTSKATEAGYDALIRSTIAEFQQILRLMRDDISGRLSFFDGETYDRFLKRADLFEDEITDWFDAYKRARPFDQRSSLPKVLIECQNELLGVIKDFEFKTWS